MDTIYLVIFFILGTLFGSFFTVVGLHLPKGEPFFSNRSHCDHCKHQLSLIDMIPILSFLCLRGKCRYCKEKIDSLSTIMELFTGILFALSYYAFGLSYQLFIGLGIVSMLIIITVSDMSYLIIPDELIIFFSLYFIIFQFLFLGLKECFYHILSGVFLFAVMYLIMIFGNKAFKKESLGGGDIKLMFIFGLLLNPLLGTMSIFIGSILALPISILILKKDNEKLVPFGPFLLIALTLLYFTGLTPDVILSFFRF